MTFFQFVLIGLLVVTTLGSYIEAASYPKCRFTFDRILLSLILPASWFYIIKISPLESWVSSASALFDSFLWTALYVVLCFIFAVVGPAFFVISTGAWISSALCGDIQNWFKERIQKITHKNT